MKNIIIGFVITILIVIVGVQHRTSWEEKSINDNLAKQNMSLKNDVAVAEQLSRSDELSQELQKNRFDRTQAQWDIDVLADKIQVIVDFRESKAIRADEIQEEIRVLLGLSQ